MTIDRTKITMLGTRRRFLDRDISAVYFLILVTVFETFLLLAISQYLNF